MSKCIFYTSAYNAEGTLDHTAQSVFRQTCPDWVWYIVDNGSTDGTGAMIRSYAQQDKRVVALANKQNHVWEKGNICTDVIADYHDDAWFCWIDADDEYRPDFLEKMLGFAVEHNLDIACCGNDFIHAGDGKYAGVRRLNQNLIIEGEGFSDHFPQYHQFMRTSWAKLTRLSVLRRLDHSRIYLIAYGWDTMFTTETFRNAGRIGVLAESLYNYYMHARSTSYKWNGGRIAADRILDDLARALLMDRCGRVSPQNDFFMLGIYLNAVKDTLYVLLGSRISVDEKFRHLQDILESSHTQRLLAHSGYGEEKRQLFQTVAGWTLRQNQCRKEDGARTAAMALAAAYPNLCRLVTQDALVWMVQNMPDAIPGLVEHNYQQVLGQIQRWHTEHSADHPLLTELELNVCQAANRPDDELLLLLLDIRKRRPRSSNALHTDALTARLMEKYPLLQGVSVHLAATFAQPVSQIMTGRHAQALDSFLAIQGVEIQDSDTEAYILLGQRLAAVAEHAGAYVFFCKLRVQFLIEQGRAGEAEAELRGLEELLPDDSEVSLLRKKRNGMAVISRQAGAGAR